MRLEEVNQGKINLRGDFHVIRVALVGVESLGRICLRAAEVAREGSTKCGQVDLAARWLRREPMGVQG